MSKRDKAGIAVEMRSGVVRQSFLPSLRYNSLLAARVSHVMQIRANIYINTRASGNVALRVVSSTSHVSSEFLTHVTNIALLGWCTKKVSFLSTYSNDFVDKRSESPFTVWTHAPSCSSDVYIWCVCVWICTWSNDKRAVWWKHFVCVRLNSPTRDY